MHLSASRLSIGSSPWVRDPVGTRSVCRRCSLAESHSHVLARIHVPIDDGRTSPSQYPDQSLQSVKIQAQALGLTNSDPTAVETGSASSIEDKHRFNGKPTHALWKPSVFVGVRRVHAADSPYALSRCHVRSTLGRVGAVAIYDGCPESSKSSASVLLLYHWQSCLVNARDIAYHSHISTKMHFPSCAVICVLLGLIASSTSQQETWINPPPSGFSGDSLSWQVGSSQTFKWSTDYEVLSILLWPVPQQGTNYERILGRLYSDPGTLPARSPPPPKLYTKLVFSLTC